MDTVCLNAHYSVLWGFMGYNKISISFLKQLDLKNKTKI